MSRVLIRKAEYDYKTLKPLVFEIMDSAIGGLIHKNSRIIIKPNLLAPAPPAKAVVTHPLIVKAAAEYILDRGAKPQISDSPAVSSFRKILKESGILDALDGLDVEYREFKDTVTLNIGEPFRKLEISADAVNADVLINLPKFKTHAQMLLTLGVKNLFGCIVGMKKPEWHLRAGIDREMFARLLVKVYQTVRPAMTLIDGILAMEGQGPGNRGIPKKLGFIMGSSDTVAIDNVACRILGIEPETLMTNKIAKELGLSPEEIIINGYMPEVRDYRLPEISALVFGPKRFHTFVRRHLVQRPECDDELCKLCGECWKICPAEAITHDKKRIHFDYDKCIRCYCCIEVCPHAALSAQVTMTGRAARKLLKIS